MFTNYSRLYGRLVLFALAVFFMCTQSYAEQTRALVKVGAYNNPPKIFISENGKVLGFWPELLALIATEEGWELEYVKSEWGAAITALEKGTIDIMPDVAFTKSRADSFLFAKTPVISSWSRVYVRENDNRIHTIEDLRGMRIAGLSGSANIEGPDGIKRMVQSFNLRCTVVEMLSYQEVFQALEDGFADAVITNRNFGDEYIKDHPVKMTSIMLSPVPITLAFPKDSPRSAYLAGRIDMHLARMMNDNNSAYYRLLTKYFETEIAEKKIEVFPQWLKFFIAAAAVLSVFLASAVFYTRHQVRIKTRELKNLNENLQKTIEDETAKRIHNEKLLFEQKKLADMGQMVKAIAHQWRQPLNNASLISQSMMDEWQCGESFSQAHAELFARQESIIQHMSQTIDDFITFFKPNTNKETFSVPEVVLSALRIASFELMHDKINFSFVCRCNGQECVMDIDSLYKNCSVDDMTLSGYPGHLRQVVLNLISNARDAVISAGGLYKKIQIEVFSDKENIFIDVTDTGTGITEEHIGRIFEPYFTTKEQGSGVGLGLYMCRSILQNHMNGEITLANTANGAKASVALKKL
jgi:signal transduction histidine kinase